MAITDSSGLPVAIFTASASPREVTLVGPALKQLLTTEAPGDLSGNAAYESNRLDAELDLVGHRLDRAEWK